MKLHRWAYWTVTSLFCMMMLGASFSELTKSEVVTQSLRIIGFPEHILLLLGILKLLGVAAILIPGWQTLKEWAYAGFTFDFVGAIYSFIAVNSGFQTDLIAAPVSLVLCGASYALYRAGWRRRLEKGRVAHQTVSDE